MCFPGGKKSECPDSCKFKIILNHIGIKDFDELLDDISFMRHKIHRLERLLDGRTDYDPDMVGG